MVIWIKYNQLCNVERCPFSLTTISHWLKLSLSVQRNWSLLYWLLFSFKFINRSTLHSIFQSLLYNFCFSIKNLVIPFLFSYLSKYEETWYDSWMKGKVWLCAYKKKIRFLRSKKNVPMYSSKFIWQLQSCNTLYYSIQWQLSPTIVYHDL